MSLCDTSRFFWSECIYLYLVCAKLGDETGREPIS